jgi:hypothetical protein
LRLSFGVKETVLKLVELPKAHSAGRYLQAGVRFLYLACFGLFNCGCDMADPAHDLCASADGGGR